MFEAIKLIFTFIAWVVVGVFVLPCVFVASTAFPAWEKWGETF